MRTNWTHAALRSGVTALGALALVAASNLARADDCGRPAIFWISGSGSFDAAMNFAGAGGTPVGCAPLSTDNVTFGATPFPNSGTISFAGGESVNSLLMNDSVFTFSLGGNINVTDGVVFGNSTLTLVGGSSIISSATQGVLDGGTLVIPDSSGFSGASVNLGSLSMTGGGNISLQVGSGGIGSAISNITLSNGSTIQMQATGSSNGTLDIGSGTINGGTLSASGGPGGSTILFAPDHSGQAVTISNGSTVSAGQVYIGLGYGNTVTVTGGGTSLTALRTYVYDQLNLTGAASMSGGALTVGGGTIDVLSGAQLTNTSALVGGRGTAGLLGVGVGGQNSSWTVSGPLTVSNNGISVASGGQLNVTNGGSLVLSSSNNLTSGLLVDGQGSKLSVAGNVTVANTLGAATMAIQNQGTVTVGGALTVANAANGQLVIQSGGTVNDANAVLGVSTGMTGTVTISSGAWNTSGTLTVGQNGIGAVNQSGGSVSTQEWMMGSAVSNNIGSEYTMSAGTLNVSDVATLQGTMTQTGGNVSITSDLDPQGAAYKISGSSSTLSVGGNLNIGTSDGSGKVIEKGGATVTINGTLNIGNGFYQLGACACGGASSDSSVLTAGALTISAGSLAQNGGSVTVTNNLSIAGTADGALYRLVAGNASVGGTTTIASGGASSAFTESAGTFQSGPMTIGANGVFTLSGGSEQAASLTTTAGGQFVQTGGTANNKGLTANAGSMSIQASTFTSGGNFINSGALTVANATLQIGSGTVLQPGAFIQAGGSTTLSNGTIDPAAVAISGGSFGGTGTVVGSTSIEGATLEVGGPAPGALHFVGSLAQSGGTMNFLVGPNGSTGFVVSDLVVNPGNSVTVTGADLVLQFASGANPLSFLAAGHFNIDDLFADSNGSTFSANYALGTVFTDDVFQYETSGGQLADLDFNPSTGNLTVPGTTSVPEPGTSGLFGAALVLLGASRFRRRVRANEA
jgi:fibronectin-binding autotransporter adhesin